MNEAGGLVKEYRPSYKSMFPDKSVSSYIYIYIYMCFCTVCIYIYYIFQSLERAESDGAASGALHRIIAKGSEPKAHPYRVAPQSDGRRSREEPPVGIEPTTVRLRSARSTAELYRQVTRQQRLSTRARVEGLGCFGKSSKASAVGSLHRSASNSDPFTA